MNQKYKAFLKIFEKLGTPLIASVNEVSARTQTPSGENQDAEKLAQLLTLVTKASVDLADIADITESDIEKDDLRLSLTTIIAPLIGSSYQLSGKIPEEQDLGKLSESFGALSSYLDNFMAIREAGGRVAQLEDGQYFADENQIKLQTLGALVPLANSIIAFSFGQKPAKLVKIVTDRLITEAKNLQTSLLPDLGGAEAAHAQLTILRGLVVIYSQCHFAEMGRILNRQNQNRASQSPSIDPVWKAFEERLAMLEVIASVVSGFDDAPTEAVGETSSQAPEVSDDQYEDDEDEAMPVPTPPGTSAMAEPGAHVAPVVAEQPPPKNKQSEPANPMSFFAHEKEEHDDGSSASSAG